MKLPGFPNPKPSKEEELNSFPDLQEREEPKKIKTKYLVIFFIILLFLESLFLGNFLYSKYFSPSEEVDTNQAQTFPVSTLKPSKRAEIFEFNHEKSGIKPEPYKIIIDPSDPKSGETQKLTVYIDHTSPITTATAVLETDNNQIEQPLTLSDGNDKTGTWTTTWKAEDTFNDRYQISLIISDDVETYEGGVLLK